MNNINEYKEQEAKSLLEKQYTPVSILDISNFKVGFDCAMNLGLAVKFAEWLSANSFKRVNENRYAHWNIQQQGVDSEYVSGEELFDYWVENILKIE